MTRRIGVSQTPKTSDRMQIPTGVAYEISRNLNGVLKNSFLQRHELYGSYQRKYYVGTGLVELAKSRFGGVPVLTSKRTATRAVSTITTSVQSKHIKHFFDSP
jgi:hypothetical protein